jgi:hypothetical protein
LKVRDEEAETFISKGKGLFIFIASNQKQKMPRFQSRQGGEY